MGVTVSVVTQSFLSNLPCPSLSAQGTLCKHSLNTRGLKATGETPPSLLHSIHTGPVQFWGCGLGFSAVGCDACTPSLQGFLYGDQLYVPAPKSRKTNTWRHVCSRQPSINESFVTVKVKSGWVGLVQEVEVPNLYKHWHIKSKKYIINSLLSLHHLLITPPLRPPPAWGKVT